MVVILHPDQYDDWLGYPVEEAPDFFTHYPAKQLVAHAAPMQRKKAAQQTLLGLLSRRDALLLGRLN